jgi:hypothetical protein
LFFGKAQPKIVEVIIVLFSLVFCYFQDSQVLLERSAFSTGHHEVASYEGVH